MKSPNSVTCTVHVEMETTALEEKVNSATPKLTFFTQKQQNRTALS